MLCPIPTDGDVDRSGVVREKSGSTRIKTRSNSTCEMNTLARKTDPESMKDVKIVATLQIPPTEDINNIVDLTKHSENVNNNDTADSEKRAEKQKTGADNEEGWTKVTRKSRKTNQPTKNIRPEPIKGSNTTSSILKAAQVKSWIFLTGFDPTTNEDMIINHLKNNDFGEGCICEKMVTRKDKTKSSFRLGVPQDRRDAIMSANLWPCGIMVNHFINLQRLQTTRSHNPQIMQK